MSAINLNGDDPEGDCEAAWRREEELARLLTPFEFACWKVGRQDWVVRAIARDLEGRASAGEANASLLSHLDKLRAKADAAFEGEL